MAWSSACKRFETFNKFYRFKMFFQMCCHCFVVLLNLMLELD